MINYLFLAGVTFVGYQQVVRINKFIWFRLLYVLNYSFLYKDLQSSYDLSL